MMAILIVEDNIQESENLKRMLHEVDKSLNIYEAQSKREALNISNRILIDIFYLDINLIDSTGIDLARELRQIKRYEFNWIIFTTSHAHYMVEAFKEIHCYDYILKPYDKKDIMTLTSKLMSGRYTNIPTENEKKHIVFDLKSGISIKIYVEEIMFIEVNLRTCTIHTKNGKYEVKGVGLKKVLELIDCGDIIQSYKSFLINVKQVEKIQSIDSKLSEIYFQNYNETALLGYKYKNILLEKFKKVC